MKAWGEVSTDQAGARDSLALWTDTLWHLLGHLRSSVHEGSSFRGKLLHSSIGNMKLCQLSASSHRVERTPDLIKQDDRGFLKVVVQLEGCARLEQDGRSAPLAPGSWSIYDTSRPYTIANTSDVEQFLLLLPREQVLTEGVSPEHALVRPYSARTGVGRLACETMRAAFDEIRSSDTQPVDGIADSIARLIRHSLLEHAGRRSDLSVRETLRDLIKAYIERNLRNPGLSIDQLALVFNCTKRNLHKTFGSEEATLCNYIWQLRLERCRRDLALPALSSKSITDIAYSWGFNSSTHFSRAFRQAYGDSPRAYRLFKLPRARPRSGACASGAAPGC